VVVILLLVGGKTIKGWWHSQLRSPPQCGHAAAGRVQGFASLLDAVNFLEAHPVFNTLSWVPIPRVPQNDTMLHFVIIRRRWKMLALNCDILEAL
jgi:hypothetical protein